MTLRRRDILSGAGGIVASAAVGGVARAGARPPSRRTATLLLHSAGLGDHRLAARLREDGAGCSEQLVHVSTHAAFGAMSALLDRAKGQRLVALLDDSDELAIDMLLTQRGARDRTRRRADGGVLLLTATL